jgi:glycine cleavage system aminomethyltransferase T
MRLARSQAVSEVKREHILKTWPNAFAAVKDGRKRFEYRCDDRGFEVGDVLVLREWDPVGGVTNSGDYVWRCWAESKFNDLRVRVTYIARGAFGIPQDYCVMSIVPELSPPPPEAKEMT